MHRLKYRNCRVYKDYGKFHGYPKCCISKFIRTSGLPGRSKTFRRTYDRSVLSGTGYVPCGHCFVLSGARLKTLIKKINANKKMGVEKFEPIKKFNQWNRKHFFFTKGKVIIYTKEEAEAIVNGKPFTREE